MLTTARHKPTSAIIGAEEADARAELVQFTYKREG